MVLYCLFKLADGSVEHLFDVQVRMRELEPGAAPIVWEGQGLVLAFAEHL